MFIRRRWLFGLILLGLVVASHFSFAHSRFNPAGNLPGRSTDAGLKTAPCGGIARTLTPKILASGSVVRVDWQETINHPGYFEFYFSAAGDNGFVKLLTVQDTMDGTTDLPHNNSVDLQLPSGNCTDCTIQMIQVMTENPASPSFYYSCADIQLTTQLQSVSPTTPVPTATSTPSTTAPTDPNSCH